MIKKEKIKVVLWNSDGMTPIKFQYIKSILKLNKANIICLIETHNQEIKFNLRNWKIINFPSNNIRTEGFILMFRKDIKIINVEKLSERYIKICISLGENAIFLNILVIYGFANKQGTKEWWEKLNLKNYNIIMGDFNMVIDKERDRINNNSNPKNGSVVKYLEEQLKDYLDVAVLKKNLQMTFFRNKAPCSRLDRFYVHKSLKKLIKEYGVIPTDKLNDHLPITMSLSRKSVTKKKKRARIQNLNKEMINFIRNLKPGLSWSETKSKLIQELENINEQHLSYFEKSKQKFKKILKKIPKKSKKYIIYQTKLNNIISNYTAYREALYNTGDWKQKDNPSKKLTEYLKPKNNFEVVREIRNNKGEVVHSHRGIEKVFVDFYTDLYSTKEIKKDLLKKYLKRFWNQHPNDESQEDLMSDISPKELEDTIKSRNNNSSPGNDKVNYQIFKKMNPETLTQLISLLNKVLDDPNNIPEEWNVGRIITIPKGGDTLDIKNRRPITLLTADYKILSKILADRLKPRLDNLIDLNQVGFIPNRLGFDNIIILDHLIRENNIILNIDIEKAFDSVSHDTIEIILQHLEFPEKFISLIMNLLRNAKAEINVNGKFSPQIKIGKGTRQGDPISPIIFNLVIELLQKIAHGLEGLDPPCINNTKIPILMFADDTAIISRSFKGIMLWLRVLSVFESITGLKINQRKSNFLLNKKIPKEFKNIPQVEEIKYLGFFFSSEGLKDDSKKTINELDGLASRYFFKSNNIFLKATILNTYILSKMWYKSYLINFEEREVSKMITNFLWSKMSTKVGKKPM
jgi:exonuclease III